MKSMESDIKRKEEKDKYLRLKKENAAKEKQLHAEEKKMAFKTTQNGTMFLPTSFDIKRSQTGSTTLARSVSKTEINNEKLQRAADLLKRSGGVKSVDPNTSKMWQHSTQSVHNTGGPSKSSSNEKILNASTAGSASIAKKPDEQKTKPKSEFAAAFADIAEQVKAQGIIGTMFAKEAEDADAKKLEKVGYVDERSPCCSHKIDVLFSAGYGRIGD